MYYSPILAAEITKLGKKYLNQFRYKLHAKVKKEGHRVKSKEKTIYVAFDKREDLSINVKILRDSFGYAVQTEIQ
jgi:hypothetical protein